MVAQTKTVSMTKQEFFTKWDNISTSVAQAFRFTDDETKKFKEKPLAQLIAAIPFLAGCEDPERTAICHLGTYILSVQIKIPANCKPTDDAYIMKRLELVNNFIGGDPEIIEKGMSLIALNMLSDYKRDIHEDILLSKHNPLVSGSWDFEKSEDRLLQTIRRIDCPVMDEIFDEGVGTRDYWEMG
jgi:hypothetical protein